MMYNRAKYIKVNTYAKAKVLVHLFRFLTKSKISDAYYNPSFVIEHVDQDICMEILK